jgi:hypothetical protein
VSAIRSRRLILVVTGAILVGGAGAATAAVLDNNGEQAPPVSFAPRGVTDVQPALTAPEAIAAALNGITAQKFSQVSVGSPPADAGAGAAGNWLYGTTITSGDDQSRLEAIWEFDLVQGAVAESLATNGNLSSGVSGYSLRITRPDGSIEVVTGGAGDVIANQQFPAGTDPDARIQTRVQSVLTRYGVRAQITVLHPLGAAVEIAGTVPAMKDLAGKIGQMQNEIAGLVPRLYEGVFLSLSDVNGPFAILASANRAGVGRMWIRPGVASEDFGLEHG